MYTHIYNHNTYTHYSLAHLCRSRVCDKLDPSRGPRNRQQWRHATGHERRRPFIEPNLKHRLILHKVIEEQAAETSAPSAG